MGASGKDSGSSCIICSNIHKKTIHYMRCLKLCSICLEVFSDPVSTPCGHNFCKICLSTYWNNSQDCRCPNCKETFKQRPDLKINTTLRDVVDEHKKKCHEEQAEVVCDICSEGKLKAVKSCLVCQSSYCETHLEPHLRVSGLQKHKLIDPVKNLLDYICQKHDRPLGLFCRDDQTCVCLICTDGEHKNHNTVPLEEETEEKKIELLKAQTDVQQMIQDRIKKIQDIKHSAEFTRVSLNKPLKKFICYVFICFINNVVEFSDLMRSVERCQSELLEMMEEKQKAAEKHDEDVIKDLEQEITELKKRNIELEQISHTQHHLQLIQVPTSLSYAAIKVMDVTLDPDTAHPELILSDDEKQVRHGGIRHKLPDNPKRFDGYPIVLGKEGFSSGRFYYEVQVKGKTQWILGVVRESINRKEFITLTPVKGFWAVIMIIENYYLALGDPPVSLSLSVKPLKVGVFVDYEEGLVSFYDVDNRSHIYSFTDQSFTEKLYPYFCPGLNDKGKNPLIITPSLLDYISHNATRSTHVPICLEVFSDPVSTPCGHNFCKICLSTYWNNSQDCRCPNCKETFKQRPDLKINTTLRDLVDEHKKKTLERQSEAA
ncbi:putative E3 ubiquitin-protein ligase TRIM39 [Triplophysa rosa]|uniref:E3 ubiquitin-protein ligase TRIM39 n=1 Tax=Triplophysa rosa TaxID=992332 RepID=A0A9W7T439_TRIRA|nr:putative E3 ubiquitin-protein ligase TRIM39 [Triplophysa rosa]